jgi:hypothetical protein
MHVYRSTHRLHMDSLDTLYVNIQGNLTMHLYSPEYSLCMRTIAPTYYVQENGFSFQYKEALGDNYKGDITTYYYSYANNISDPVSELFSILYIVYSILYTLYCILYIHTYSCILSSCYTY